MRRTAPVLILASTAFFAACGGTRAEGGDAGATNDASRPESCWPPGMARCRSNVRELCGPTGWWRKETESCSVTPSVSVGGGHTCALGEDGRVWCWGSNASGELGLGDVDNRGDGEKEMGNYLPPVHLGTGHFATAIAAGSSYSCAILDDGQVKCWGSELYGLEAARGDGPGEMGDQLPFIELGPERRAVALAAGGYHACALLDNQRVKCWGSNDTGQLGLGRLLGLSGYDDMPEIDLGTGGAVSAIAAGSWFTCALLIDGRVKCWGRNTEVGSLGLGDTESRGDANGEMGDNLPEVDLGTARRATAIGVGGMHACALLDDRELKCWGANDYGQLGLGDKLARGALPDQMGDRLAPVTMLGPGAAAIALGSDHSCYVLQGLLRCWGYNQSGELGLGDTYHRGDHGGEVQELPPVNLGAGRTVVSASVGDHICALLDNRKIKCWGANSAGELGLGDQAPRGTMPGEMGDNLPPVDFGR